MLDDFLMRGSQFLNAIAAEMSVHFVIIVGEGGERYVCLSVEQASDLQDRERESWEMKM